MKSTEKYALMQVWVVVVERNGRSIYQIEKEEWKDWEISKYGR